MAKKNRGNGKKADRREKAHQQLRVSQMPAAPQNACRQNCAGEDAGNAASLMAAGDYQAAADVLLQTVDKNPADASSYGMLAQCLVNLNQLTKARKAQEIAVSLAPQVVEFQAELAKIMVLQSDFAGARLVIEKLMPLVEPARRQQLEPLLLLCIQQSGGRESQPTAQPVKEPTGPKLPQAPRLELTDSPLNILFVQEGPCIRNYKTATALRARGHRVTLGYTKMLLSQMYKGLSDSVYNECIKINQYRDLWDMSGRYDVVHCHNEPDVLTVTALAGDAPVIHDTHDLISLRADGDQNLAFFEGTANRGAHGRIYTTPYQRDEAQRLYGAPEPSLVFYNYTSAGDLPKRMLPKLSAKDGKVHIVYEGGIGGNGHRNFIDLFLELARNGVHVHILPTGYNPEMAKFFSAYPEIHYNQPLSPKEIMEAMSQYDIGIIPFNIDMGNKRFLDSTIANKLFEYLAAGLPVVASPLQSYVDYFAENRVGRVFENAADIIRAIPELLKVAEDVDLCSYTRTYEGEVLRLEAFYRQIIADYRAGRSANNAKADSMSFDGVFNAAHADAFGVGDVDYVAEDLRWFGEEVGSA